MRSHARWRFAVQGLERKRPLPCRYPPNQAFCRRDASGRRKLVPGWEWDRTTSRARHKHSRDDPSKQPAPASFLPTSRPNSPTKPGISDTGNDAAQSSYHASKHETLRCSSRAYNQALPLRVALLSPSNPSQHPNKQTNKQTPHTHITNMSSLLNKAKDALGKSGGSSGGSTGGGQQSGVEKGISGQAHTRKKLLP
jgi:hypothetical protein